jgi:hypothetical protein
VEPGWVQVARVVSRAFPVPDALTLTLIGGSEFDLTTAAGGRHVIASPGPVVQSHWPAGPKPTTFAGRGTRITTLNREMEVVVALTSASETVATPSPS